MSADQLERAVRELQDRQAIYDCLMRYSRAVDRLDRELLLSVYHDDAVDDHGMFVGDPQEFADWVVGMNREGEPLVTSGGRYIDRFERRDGRWAIAARVCVRDWAPLPEQPDFDDPSTLTAIRAVLPPAVREFMAGGPKVTRDRSDPSYDRPLKVDQERLRRSRELRQG